MKNVLIYFGLMILLSACGQKSELVKHQWIIVEGTYNGQPIDFHSTDLILFVDGNGHQIRSVWFGKDQTTILPGINTPNLSARWMIEDGKLKITVDSPRDVYPDLSFLDSGDSIPAKEETEHELRQTEENERNKRAFEKAKEIYEQGFSYYISRDTLILRGQKGEIRAVRDKILEKLIMKN